MKRLLAGMTLAATTVLSQADTMKTTNEISATALIGTRLLVLGPQDRTFTEEEQQTVIGFVERGGSLLAVIDEEVRTPLLPKGMNDILRHFGLEFTVDTSYLHNCGARALAGEINACDRDIPYSGGRAVKGGTAFAWRLDENGNLAEPYGASIETVNGGRIIALSEGMAALGMGTADGERLSGVPRDPAKTTYWGKDSEVFMREVRNWLLKTTP